jgi:serine acetyltransferase
MSVPDRSVIAGSPARVVGRNGSFAYVQYRGMEADPARQRSLRDRDREIGRASR